MPFDQEDLDLQDKLRKKYAAKVASIEQEERFQTGVDEASIIANQMNEDKARLAAMKTGREVGAEAVNPPQVEVRICPQCQGNKVYKEYYGFREMSRHCDHCDGEGTLTFGGPKKQSEGEGSSAFPSYQAARKAGTKKAKDPRVTETRKLEKRIAKYTKEAETVAAQRETSADHEERQLLEELETQLKEQISQLQQQLDDKFKEVLPTATVEELPTDLMKW